MLSAASSRWECGPSSSASRRRMLGTTTTSSRTCTGSRDWASRSLYRGFSWFCCYRHTSGCYDEAPSIARLVAPNHREGAGRGRPRAPAPSTRRGSKRRRTDERSTAIYERSRMGLAARTGSAPAFGPHLLESYRDRLAEPGHQADRRNHRSAARDARPGRSRRAPEALAMPRVLPAKREIVLWRAACCLARNGGLSPSAGPGQLVHNELAFDRVG